MKNTILSTFFNKYDCDKAKKHKYDLIYEKFFNSIRYDNINILEIGIFKGNSIQAWLDYFPNATIYGVDIFERVKPENIKILNHPRVKWAKCDSTISNVKEWKDIQFDIIIDDGLHTTEANLKTFNSFKNQLRGSYYIEDVWPLNIMSNEELNHSWIQIKKDYSIEKYNSLLNELNQFGKVEHFDLRKKTMQPDSYIIKITK